MESSAPHNRDYNPSGTEELTEKVKQISFERAFLYSPGYVLESPSKKVASGMGISCIWQLQSPWGMLPGLGQEVPGKLSYGNVEELEQSFIR